MSAKLNQPTPEITAADIEFQQNMMICENELQIELLKARTSRIVLLVSRLPLGAEINAMEISDDVNILLGIDPCDDEEAYYANIPNDPTVI